ncbi:hypothetical protein [Xanthomonas nasturtii]|uniref:hypothetical protein n=1 Tax=Xanthomonas nasturtii TaxID=1843581 RepID=UPI001290205A|nr:hypothetical protein [Xanthomonas nasturtii]WVL58532.1 hypothetical protein M3O54_010175 [Xanthomonas nasturtii]
MGPDPEEDPEDSARGVPVFGRDLGFGIRESGFAGDSFIRCRGPFTRRIYPIPVTETVKGAEAAAT